MPYDNTDRGALFRNDRREGNQPEYTGKINVGGTEYRLAAWVRESNAGRKYFSLAVSFPDKPKEPEQDFDDDIPF